VYLVEISGFLNKKMVVVRGASLLGDMREKQVFGVVTWWCGCGEMRGKAGQETVSILWSEKPPAF